jgi:hypothetical protein
VKNIVIKKDELGIELTDSSVFIQKRKFGSDRDWTIQLSLAELKQIVEAVEKNV